MKVYHVALLIAGQPNTAMGRAFKELFQYKEIDWLDIRRRAGTENLNKRIIADVRGFKPDLVFMQIQSPGVIQLKTAYVLRQLTTAVNWTGDVRSDIRWYIELAPHMASTMFTNMTDVKSLQQRGLRSHYLQIGYDEMIYNPVGMVTKSPDIIFLGNNYIKSAIKFPGSPERVEMVNFLRGIYGDQFQVFGHGWGSRVLNTSEEPAFYRSTKIAINQNHFLYERFSSDRIFRIMACGCFCLTRYYPGIEEEFTIGKHLDVWHTFEELKDKIDFYLANPEKRHKIEDAGYELVASSCTWKHRIKQLIQLYDGQLDTRNQKQTIKEVLPER